MSEELRYDPAIIQKFAATMYDRAATIERVYALVGLLAGGLLGHALAPALATPDASTLPVAVVVGGIGAFIGYRIGSAIAFWYRLGGHFALMLKAIEQNTRRSSDGPAPPLAEQKIDGR